MVCPQDIVSANSHNYCSLMTTSHVRRGLIGHLITDSELVLCNTLSTSYNDNNHNYSKAGNNSSIATVYSSKWY